METIARKSSEMVVGKRYFIDAVKDVSYELVEITDVWLVFKHGEGKKCYIEHTDGSIKFLIDTASYYHEIINAGVNK